MIAARGKTLVAVLLAGSIAGLLLGLLVGWVIWPVRYYDTDIVDLKREYKEDYVVMVGAAYALDQDLEQAETRLAKLEMPEVAQFVAILADQYITSGADLTDIRYLVGLAQALGTSTEEMLTSIATSTATSTSTPTPSPTSTSAPTSTPTEGPTPTVTSTTARPTPTSVPATATPRPQPPTSTPLPRLPTETPALGVDFKVVDQRMLTIHENGGCQGLHIVRAMVVDKNGQPLNGVVMNVTWAGGWNQIVSGAKAAGLVEFEMHGAYRVQVVGDVFGRQYSSDISRWLDSWSPAVGDLIAGGYCADEADCERKRDKNLLCDGHYSYEVVFQRQW